MKKSILILLLLLLVPGSLSALDNGEALGDIVLAGVLTTTGAGITFVVGVAGLFVLTTTKSKPEPEKVTAFLKANSIDFRAELALGSGEDLQDFAKLMAIQDKDIPRFKNSLRRERKYIYSLCDPKTISSDRTKELIAWVDLHYPAI